MILDCFQVFLYMERGFGTLAYIRCKMQSQILQTCVDVNLYFPSDLPAEVGYNVNGVLTLLHGLTNSGDDWVQMTAASRYAADNGLVLIMPDCGNSFYQNMRYGGAYKTFVTEEMPMLLNRMFRLPTRREQNFIAGLSMGGYGALYLGLSRPDLYAGCASFSGAVELPMLLTDPNRPGVREVFAPIFGDDLVMPPASDLHALLHSVAALPAAQQPKIMITNGLQDIEPFYILQQNDALHKFAKSLGLASYCRMQWNGVHEWNFWDRSLVYAIDYFLGNGYAKRKLDDWRSAAVRA